MPVRQLLSGLRVMDALHAPHELLWRPEFGPAILARMAMPPEPVIELLTGSLRLVAAMSLIQEHTSIPIVIPEKLAPEQVRDILTTARLLRDGVLNSTWTTGTLVLRPEAPDDALEAIGPNAALFIGGDDWVVTIGQEGCLWARAIGSSSIRRSPVWTNWRTAAGEWCLSQLGVGQAERRNDSDRFRAARYDRREIAGGMPRQPGRRRPPCRSGRASLGCASRPAASNRPRCRRPPGRRAPRYGGTHAGAGP